MKNQILLKNINYFDVEKSVMVENVNILIEDDCIKKIFNDLPIDKKHFQIIECSGKFAVPGLFECHAHLCHLSLENDQDKKEILEEFVRKGITQVRDVGGPFNVLKKMKEDIKSNKINGPEIFYAGPMLEKSPLHWGKFNEKLPGFTVPINTKKDVDKIIIQLKENRASLIKTFNKFDKGIYKYLVEETKKITIPITHDPGFPLFQFIPIDLAIDFGIRCFEHGFSPWSIVLKEDLQQRHNELISKEHKPEEVNNLATEIFSLGIDSISVEKLNKLAKKMRNNNVYFCPTLSVFNEKPEDSEIDSEEMPKTFNSVASYCTKEIIKCGVRILVGIDSCMPETINEMKLLKKIELSESEIIKGATKYPAEWLNVYNKYGSISSNKKANLLIVNNNPLNRIENLEDRFIVIKEGKIVFKK